MISNRREFQRKQLITHGAQALDLIAQGFTIPEAAELIGTSRARLYRAVAECKKRAAKGLPVYLC